MIVVRSTTVKFAAGMPPNNTAVTAVNLSPVMVTLVPPVVRPSDGVTRWTAGSVDGSHDAAILAGLRC